MVDRNVTYRLRGDAGDFTRVVNRAEATLSGSFKRMRSSSAAGGKAVAKDYDSIARAAGGVENKVKSLALTIGGFALGGGGFAALASQALKTADEIAKTADRLGLATDELQRYQFAAEISGITTQEFNVAFQRFGRRLGEGAQGFGEAQGALRSLNISLRGLDGTLRPVNEVFDEAIQKLAQIEDVTLRNALAAKLFDSEGVKLVQLGENLAQLKAEADALGVIIPEEMLRNAEAMSDKLTIVQRVISVKLTAALVKLAPQMDALAEGALYAAENFDTIVNALGTFAKLLVAIKLAGFIKGMYGVAAGGIAASKGLNALRISIQGLKAATFVGLGLIALEIAIQKFLGAIDDTDESIEESIKGAEKAIKESTANIAKTYDDVSSELIQERQNYNSEIDKLVKAEIKTLEDALKAQEKVVNEQRGLLKDATKDAQDAAEEFEKAFAKLGQRGGEVETPDLIDVSREITSARRALDAGDNEGAVEAALRAKDVVLALQETGKYTEAQLSGTLKKAQEVQAAASGALVAEEEAALAQAEGALQKIQSQINLIKGITFDFDETKSLEGAQKVLDQIKNLITKTPLVVPVELKPLNGVQADAVEAPGFARGGYIQGPGTSTSDSILARLSRGEYVLRADAVKKYGLDFLNALNAGRLPGFAAGGLVTGRSTGASGTPVNLNLGGRDYPMTASPDIAVQLRRDTHIEQLKKGRRT